MRKLAFYAALVLLTLSALYLIYVFRAVVILFLLSLFTASAVRPLVSYLTKRGLSTTLAIFITYGAGTIILGATLFAIGRIGIPELGALSSRVLNRYQSAHQIWSSGTTLQQSLANTLPPPQALLDTLAAEEGTLLAQALLRTVSSIASLLAAMAIIIVLSIYWTVDRLHFEGLWLSLLPPARRGRVRRYWNEVQDGVGEYIRSQGLQALLAVAVLAAGFHVMGIDYPLLLALLGAITWLIPLVGFLFAVVAALLVGLVHSPILGLLAAVFTIVSFIAIQILVEEQLLHTRRNFSYLLVALLMIPLADVYGFFGLLAAPPLAVSIESLAGALFARRRQQDLSGDRKTRLEELSRRLRDLEDQAAARDERLSPELLSLVERLDTLLEHTSVALAEE